MKLEIIKKQEMPLLSRTRYSIMAVYEGATPSRLNLIKKVSALIKAKENLVVIKHIYTRFGQQTSKIIVHVYKNDKDMQQIEEKALMKRHLPKEKKEKAPEKKEEKPKKEAKTEQKPEEKKEGKMEEVKEENRPKEKKEEKK